MPPKKGPKSLSKKGTFQYKRERNAREKARCLRLAQQVDELKDILLEGGWDVVKTTKAAVLNATAQYIRHLQKQTTKDTSSSKALLVGQEQQPKQKTASAKTLPKAPLDQNKPRMDEPPQVLLPYPTVKANMAGTPTQTFAIGLPPSPPTPVVVLPGGASQASSSSSTMLPVVMGLGTGLDYRDIFDCAPIGMVRTSRERERAFFLGIQVSHALLVFFSCFLCRLWHLWVGQSLDTTDRSANSPVLPPQVSQRCRYFPSSRRNFCMWRMAE